MFPFSGRVGVARNAHRHPLGLVLRSEPSAVGFKAAFRAAWRPAPADLAGRGRGPREG